jgi:hypothetical protein
VEGWILGVPGFILAGKERNGPGNQPRHGGNFVTLENCGAIATFVVNFCRADFSGPRYGKP